ncbi:MAG: DUF3857 and transglutaminase domain-containing protein [Candidatus Aegiribacteria sp.]|nr:DUF3857 and transglutaminase domain-containing protein [Candidatus Aegiribacteria sp.]
MALILLLLISAPDAVYLEHSIILDCSSPDSGYFETSREIIVPLTAAGVNRYGRISASFRNTWESLEVTASIGHWRSGRGDDCAILRETPHSSLLSGGRLESSLREVVIEFPGIEIGDTLKVEIRRSISYLPMGDFYSYTFYAASRDSIHQGVFKVLWPSARDIHIQSEGFFESQRYALDGGTECMIFRSGPRNPILYLPFSPDPALISSFVTVSSHSPEEVSRGLYPVLDRNCMVEYTDLADSIIAIAGNRPQDLCGWVSEEIEYLSGNWGYDPGYSPRNPIETLDEMSGVCRDRAVLLLWLLRRTGHMPTAILTSVSDNLEPYPGSRSFDHMLVMLNDSTGETLFLDPTNSFSPEGYTYTLRGCGYLPLTPSGSHLEYFPDDTSGDILSIVIEGSLCEDSSIISGSISVSFSGTIEELFRSMLSGIEPSVRNLLIERLLGLLPGSELTIEGDLSSISTPLGIHGTGRWKCGIVQAGESVYLIIPGLETLDVVSSRAAAYILPMFREDIYIETPYTAHLSMLLRDLPPGHPELPEPFESGNCSIKITLVDDALLFEEYLSLQPAVPNRDQLSDIREGILAALTASTRTVMFRR